jgi:hypothetical protein
MEMRNFICLAIAWGLALPASSQPKADPEKAWETRYQKTVATAKGKDYQGMASLAVWGDMSIMKECAPSNAPNPPPVKVYAEIFRDGKVGKVVAFPASKAAECIARRVQATKFPKPPTAPLVVKLDMKFI